MDVDGNIGDCALISDPFLDYKRFDSGGSISEAVIEVIVSLYIDEIAPSIPDILRRFAEKYPEPHIRSTKDLLRIVRSSCELAISETNPPMVYMTITPPEFRLSGWIDPYDSSYVHSKSLWDGMNHFVTCATFSYPALLQNTGGRYCMAKFIKDFSFKSSIPCSYCGDFIKSVSNYSLGRLCHLVQSAINRGILCYEEKSLQPAIACRHISQVLLSKLSLLPSSDEIQTMEELETYLIGLLRSSPSHQLDMSQLRKSLLLNYGKFLNPRRLGFIKVSELFSLTSMFRIETTINNTVIIKLLH